MWSLSEIKAKNICAFKELAYKLEQGHTTLVFGNNMDNDSQGSNGSGKSALIECVAIALTGETLRNVKSDEIINDAAQTAEVSATLVNAALGQTLEVVRQFSRKSPQVVRTSVNGQDVPCSSVAEYNKYVLHMLDLTRDDIFSNYILSKHKYESFLMASDREKKETINRFSNGAMVDEAIVSLQADMEEAGKMLADAQSRVSVCQGRVDAINDQLENAASSMIERKAARERRVAELQESIAAIRGKIRERADERRKQDEHIDAVAALSEEIGQMELVTDMPLTEKYRKLKSWCDGVGVMGFQDYEAKSQELGRDMDACMRSMEEAEAKVRQCEEALAKSMDANTVAVAKFERDSAQIRAEFNANKVKMEQADASRKKLLLELSALRRQIQEHAGEVVRLKTLLAGSITCPKCGHEFLLKSERGVEEIREEICRHEAAQSDAEKAGDEKTTQAEKDDTVYSEASEANRALRIQADGLLRSKTESETAIRIAEGNSQAAASALKGAHKQKELLEIRLEGLSKAMFDEVFSLLEADMARADRKVEVLAEQEADDNRRISAAEASIAELQAAKDDDLATSLKESLERYGKELQEAQGKEKDAQSVVAGYKSQEVMFNEFKTYLANTKVQALNDITNEFLEAIGSDIRISMSGYTMLKSGKVRDKISISLLRDGVDCGSFDKFSEGEKARVNLANILAMHRLTNANCDGDRGLDLLILDEILDATDEAGLSSMFDALNRLHLTSWVVSHGNIAESYPYRLVVSKHNGISSI